MKRALILLFYVCSSSIASAQQSLLPDGGFEILRDSCEYYGGNIAVFKYWDRGTTGTTDPYCCCYYGPPTNQMICSYPGGVGGSQYPRTDSGFAGIYAGGWVTENLNYREYVQTELYQPLTAGIKYYGGFYVNMGENGKMFSVNNIGMLLTDTIQAASSIGNGGINGVIHGNPQVMNDTNMILDDTTGWVLVADTFVAQGGELYLTIGNFRDDLHTIYVRTSYPCGSNTMDSASYYFIDDVFLYCVDTACPPFNPIGLHENVVRKNLSRAFPNPSNGRLVITSEVKADQGLLLIYDLSGRIVKELTLNFENGQAEISTNLDNGVYIYRLMADEIEIAQGRIIITK